jgi:hydrogenase nickel incorporation protein HypB
MSGTWFVLRTFDLGEAVRVALLSVTEGEDKPLKYPGIFNSADVAVITKMDLAAPCEFQRDVAIENLNAVRPGMRIFEVSARRGVGVAEWVDYVAGLQQHNAGLTEEATTNPVAVT